MYSNQTPKACVSSRTAATVLQLQLRYTVVYSWKRNIAYRATQIKWS